MAVTQLTTRQLGSSSVTRDDVDTTTTTKAIIAKAVQGTGITIASTGIDAGTGDVTINSNLSTGVSGGQSVIGGTASGNGLTLSSTSNVTKGLISFGTSSYDENANKLSLVGTETITSTVGVIGASTTSSPIQLLGSGSFTDTTSQLRTLNVTSTATGSNSGGALIAINFTSSNNITAGSIGTIECGSATVSMANVGTTSNAYGFRAIALLSNSGSITTNLRHFEARSPSLTSTGTIATATGLSIQAMKITGVTTGVAIEQLGATDSNNFSGYMNSQQPVGKIMAPAGSVNLTAGYSATMNRIYKIASGKILTIGSGAILRIL